MSKQEKEQKLPERTKGDLLAEKVFRVSTGCLPTLVFSEKASLSLLRKKTKRVLSLYEAYLLLKRKKELTLQELDGYIERDEIEFELFGGVESGSKLLSLLLKKEELLERRLLADSYSGEGERKSDIESIDEIEGKLSLIVKICPAVRTPNRDDSYRWKNHQAVLQSIADQRAANRRAMAHLNSQAQGARNKEMIDEATKGLGVVAAFAAVSREIDPTFINRQFTGMTMSKVVDGHSVGISSRIGQRFLFGNLNEDAHLATSFTVKIGKKYCPVLLFALFDGHGGKGAALYAEANIEKKFKRALGKFNKKTLTVEGIFKALHWSCIELSKDLIRERPGDTSGTTAAIAAIVDGMLFTANVGDSRILLDNDGECILLTEDASPGEERYRREIEERGGEVICNRIIERNSEGYIVGSLGVGRVIGDGWLRGRVSSAPTIDMMAMSEIKRGKSHLILTCDGIYEQATNTRPADIVELTHTHSEQSAELLANHITAIAWRLFSEDNLSAIVVKL